MDKFACCALIKHIFKTDLQKDKRSCAKNFISVHMKTLALKCGTPPISKKIDQISTHQSLPTKFLHPPHKTLTTP